MYRRKMLVIAVSLMLLIAACGGTEGDGNTITALEGALRLQLPDGSPSITVESIDAAVALEDLDPGADVQVLAAVELSPDGHEFEAELATITLDTGVAYPDAGAPAIIAIQRTDDGWDFPTSQRITEGPSGDAVLEADVAHFSHFIVMWMTEGTFELSPAMVTASVGQTFDVDVVLRNKTEGQAQTLSAFLTEVDRRASGTVTGEEAVGTFKCVDAGDGGYGYNLTFTTEERLDEEPSIGTDAPPVAQAFTISMMGSVGQALLSQPYLFEDRPVKTVVSDYSVAVRGDAECVEGAAEGADLLIELELQCYKDSTAPCSPVTWNDISPRVGVSLDDLPGGAATLSVRFSSQPPLPGDGRLECRAFGETANCVVIDSNGNPVGAPGPDIEADLADSGLEFDLSEVVEFAEASVRGPLRSLTPVEATYSDADGNVGGGLFGDAARQAGKDWITELIEALGD